LGLRELLRDGHAEPGEEVALPAAVELRRAAALHAKELPVLGACRNLQRHGALRGRDLDARAERCLRVGDRDLEHQIGAAALVERRRRDLDADEQIAGGTAVHPWLALALEPDARAVLRAGGHLHLVAARHALATAAAAPRARMRKREQPLAVGDDSRATAVRAGPRRRARLGATPTAHMTGGLELDGHADLDAFERLLERDADARLEIGAALGPRARGALSAAEERAEVA